MRTGLCLCRSLLPAGGRRIPSRHDWKEQQLHAYKKDPQWGLTGLSRHSEYGNTVSCLCVTQIKAAAKQDVVYNNGVR